MKNSAYWQERFLQLEQAQNQLAASGYREIERHYRQAQRELDDQIRVWYQRFAANNEISLAEARRWLTADELAEFKWDVQEYIKHGMANVDGQWAKQLENASARFHISRLEALKIRTRQSMEQLFAKQQGVVGSTLGEVYRSGYYHTAFELQRGFSLGWDIAAVDNRRLEKVLAKPWAADGRNFSERIWGNKDKLINELHTELSRNIMLGQDPQKAIDAIARKMNTSRANAGRLVMTEQAYFSSLAQRDCFQNLGVERFEIVATLDSHTSEICQEADGQVRLMSEFEPGVTAPPFHVNCRSTTVPYFDDEFSLGGERAARGEDGKT
ncbi:MAG: minor capsid protein, partial [Clostridium sp.]|nr:minor capsid protein [Clostridium sp.]